LEGIGGPSGDVVPDMPVPLGGWVGSSESREVGIRLDIAPGEAVDLGGAHVALDDLLAHTSSTHDGALDHSVRSLLRQLLVGTTEGGGCSGWSDPKPHVGDVGSAIAQHGRDLNAAPNHRVEAVKRGPLIEEIWLPPSASDIGIEEGVAPVDLIAEGTADVGVGEIFAVDELDPESIG